MHDIIFLYRYVSAYNNEARKTVDNLVIAVALLDAIAAVLTLVVLIGGMLH
jgi:hypothetical protein